MARPSASGTNRRTILVVGLVVAAALVLAGWGIAKLVGGKSSEPKSPPKITLVAPPPPPPPPPKFEKKPDPPKEQKEMKVERPVQKQEAPPPSPQLKMEGAAGDGPSAFGGGKVTNEDLSKIGSGGNGTGGGGNGLFNPFKNYSNLLKGEVQRYLSGNPALRRRQYTIELRVWVAANGALSRYELVGSTDDGDTDDAIRRAMAGLSGFKDLPPPNMPQPIRLRVVTTG